MYTFCVHCGAATVNVGQDLCAFHLQELRQHRAKLELAAQLERETLMRIAHEQQGACEYSECQECCEHEFDHDEGYMCLNCGKQGDIGELIDRVMDDMDR